MCLLIYCSGRRISVGLSLVWQWTSYDKGPGWLPPESVLPGDSSGRLCQRAPTADIRIHMAGTGKMA